MASGLPVGTVTFFFTDMEGSTRMVQSLGDRWPALLDQHDRLIRQAVTGHGGVEVRTEGDAFFAVFPSAVDAAAAATAVQESLATHRWPEDAPVRVRVGLHTGTGSLGGSDYVGLDVHRAARVSSVAHGGQILVSEATATLVERSLPDGTSLRDLGEHRLKDLLEPEGLFQIVIPGVSDGFPSLPTLDAVPHNLPMMATRFVGREDDLAAALAHLENRRIVTLLGPGGTGKTRLALQVAAEAVDGFLGGAFFVGLASITDPELVPSTVLGALGVQTASGRLSPREQLMEFVADKAMLLVLDNFEQLVEAADVVAELAERSPGSKFLVTSRVPLRISGEQEMPIPPLDVAEPGSGVEELARVESIALFVDRATAVDPGFELTDGNAAAVAALVSRLDGLPLAIELVVPKLRLLPVEAILERLDTRALAGGPRDAPERHQTMWNAISWSVEALPESCRRLFGRLAVFSGGGRLQEIEEVCGPADELGIEVLDGLAVLVDHSLVRRDRGAETRFRMLQVIREYAAAQLADSGGADELERRQVYTYLHRTEEAAPELVRKDRKRWLESLDADHDNLRTAQGTAVARADADAAMRLAFALWRYWQARGHVREGARRIDEVLALEGGDPRHRAKAIEARGSVAWWMGDIETCRASYAEALEMQRELGDPREIANALYNMGLERGLFEEDHDGARSMFAEAEAIYQELGDLAGLGEIHRAMGNMFVFTAADPSESMGLLERGTGESEAAGDVFGQGWGHYQLGEAHRRVGELAAAQSNLSRGLELLYGSGDLSATVLFLLRFAALADDQQHHERAVRLAGAAWGLGQRSGIDVITIANVSRVEGLKREVLEQLDGDLAGAYREGRAMSYDGAVEYALEGG